MYKEFKEFIMRGNVVDLAIGIIIGGAFGKIINSLVNDIIMPPIGLLIGGVDFKNLFINLSDKSYTTIAQATEAGAPILKYGLFINTILEFLIVAFSIFFMLKVINKLKKAPEPPLPDTKDCNYCFSKIPIKATKCPGCTSELKVD